MQTIYADHSISISDFKKNPAEVLRNAGNKPVAVLNHNRPAFYMVTPQLFESLMEDYADQGLIKQVRERLAKKDTAIEVNMTKFKPEQLATRYRLKFMPEALAEWNALDGSVKELLRKALKKRLIQPRLPGAELHGNLKDCYKIKLLKQGYRLVYSIEEDVLVVLVLAIDKREDMAVYHSASIRLRTKTKR